MAGNTDSGECVPTADTLELLPGSARIEVTYSAFRLKIADSNPRAARRRCESEARLRRLLVVSVDAGGCFACIPDLI
jgi:hypothetical protein